MEIYDLKSFLLTYDILLKVLLMAILFLLVLIPIIFNKKWEVFISIRIFIGLAIIILLLIIPVFLDSFPVYEKGDCFLYKKIINNKPIEEWHKGYLEKELEFLVLRVGKKNYYVSSNQPSLEDFPIKMDGLTRQSDCSSLFQK